MRALLVGLMFASLLMSVAIGDAFAGRAWLFVVAYLVLQFGRSAFLIVALRGRALGGHFVNVLVWELATAVLWVAGAIADRDARLVIALGETVLTTGNAFVGEPFAVDRLLALAIAFSGTVALWWCYFRRIEGLGVGAAGTAEGAGAVGFWGTWSLTLIVLAGIAAASGVLVAVAVADSVRVSGPRPRSSG